jgi:hypothetical protein
VFKSQKLESLFAMMLLYNIGARDITNIHSFYILFITFTIISIFISNSQAYAVEGIWRDYESMKELVKDIRNGDKDDDKMNYDKFKDSSVYKNANEDLRKCIDLADKVGEKLGDYEIVRCFENTNYFKEKYVDDNNENVGQQEQQNETNQNQNQSSSEEAVQQEELQLTENNSEQQGQQEQQNETNQNQNQSSSEEAVQQEELQLTENNSEQQGQQEQQNETNQNQNQSSSEEAVQQEELQLTENNSEQQGQQEQQNETNQNQSQNQTNDERKTQATESDVGSNDGCDPSYPDICITTYSEKLTCADIPFRNFKVLPPDSHGFDSDSDGVGCEG